MCAIAGPRRSNAIAGEPDALFLAGDETAIPAITRFLRQRRPGTPPAWSSRCPPDNVQVPLPIDDATTLTVLVRPGENLSETLAGMTAGDRPAGNVLAFVAAESGVVPVARELLRRALGHPAGGRHREGLLAAGLSGRPPATGR